jgi:hypothetical protein
MLLCFPFLFFLLFLFLPFCSAFRATRSAECRAIHADLARLKAEIALAANAAQNGGETAFGNEATLKIKSGSKNLRRYFPTKNRLAGEYRARAWILPAESQESLYQVSRDVAPGVWGGSYEVRASAAWRSTAL